MRAMVVFWDPPEARWQWALKPGFRHVFACLDDTRHWITVDARMGQPAVETVRESSYDLHAHWLAEGYRVVRVEQGPPLRTPLVVVNCVGLVKAILCIRAPFAQTPYQLYKHLTRVHA